MLPIKRQYLSVMGFNVCSLQIPVPQGVTMPPGSIFSVPAVTLYL